MKLARYLVPIIVLVVLVWFLWPHPKPVTILPPTPISPVTPPAPVEPQDPRAEKLEAFFDHYECPKPQPIYDYLSSADKYNLPYTLLPSLSVLESGCGRHQRLNNWWGWNSARTGFSSVDEGICYVSEKLATGRYYSGKTLDEKLKAYNSVNPTYSQTIKGLMAQIEQQP